MVGLDGVDHSGELTTIFAFDAAYDFPNLGPVKSVEMIRPLVTGAPAYDSASALDGICCSDTVGRCASCSIAVDRMSILEAWLTVRRHSRMVLDCR
jgi:hypothetical protein